MQVKIAGFVIGHKSGCVVDSSKSTQSLECHAFKGKSHLLDGNNYKNSQMKLLSSIIPYAGVSVK